jgi:hypothetical protein
MIFIIVEQSFTYTASEIFPTLIIRDEAGNILTIDEDYTLSYENNVNVGTGKVIITGIGNYTGTVEKEFTIDTKSIESATIITGEADQNGCYDANEVYPSLEGYELVQDIDYTKTVSIVKGTGYMFSIIEFNAIGNFSGYLSTTLAATPITPVDVSTLNIILSSYSRVYNREEFSPTASITDAGYKLQLGVDFTCTYYDNLNVGTASITVRGTGNYYGFEKIEYQITPAQMDSVDISYDDPDEDGNYDLDSIKLSYLGVDLVQDTDYTLRATNEKDGRYTYTTVEFTGRNNFGGSTSIRLQTNKDKSDISTLVFTYERSLPYAGEPRTPYVSIYDKNYSELLKVNQDYKVEYVDTTYAGSGSIIVTALSNNFYGTATLPITITPIDLAESVITCGNPDSSGCYSFDNLSVVIGDYTLSYGKDYIYEITYIESASDTIARIYIKPVISSVLNSNYGEFRVKKKTIDISTLNISLSDTSFTYNREKQTPTIVTDLKENEEYTATIPESINVGTYSVLVSAMGEDYIGAVHLTYDIVAKSIEEGEIDLGEKSDEGYYDLDNITLKVDGVTLLNTEEYTVYYTTSEREEGYMEAAVTVTGIGNYTGVIEFSCIVAKKSIFAKREVSLDKATIYIRHYGTENTGIRSGTFYLYDGIVVNNRTKITTMAENCGIVGLITGWVETDELDAVKPDPDDEDGTEPLQAGDEVRLYKINLYDTFSTNDVSSVITGRFYISKSAIYNKRIRICSYEEAVGVEKKVLGWINVADA